MDKINSHTNKYNTKFEGNNKMHEKAVIKFEDYAKTMVSKLCKRVEKEVIENPKYLPASIEEKFSSKTPDIYARELILKVRPLPKELKETTPDYDSVKWLEAVAVGPGGVETSSVLKRGSKEEILKTLNSPEFDSILLKKFEDLDIDLRSS